jgi:diadenosine tetraphosphate (Ap4A) HIT family hydrolase
MENDCVACQKISSQASIEEYTYWFLEHFADPAPVAGWLILRLKRHGEGLESLNKEEGEELGAILNDLPKSLQKITKAKTVYLCSFNESVPHLHFHFIPRYVEETKRTIDFFAMQADVKSGKIPAADKIKIEEIIKNIKNN